MWPLVHWLPKKCWWFFNGMIMITCELTDWYWNKNTFYEVIWLQMKPCGLWSHMAPYRSIWIHMAPYKMKSYEVMWLHMKSYLRMKSYDYIWSHMDPYEVIWLSSYGHMNPYSSYDSLQWSIKTWNRKIFLIPSQS